MTSRIETIFTNVSSYVTTGVETISNTPFVKDVKSGGLFNGIIGGTERERLRSVVTNLKSEHGMGAGIEYLLKKYDMFSETFKRRDIVENWRNRLISSTLGKSESMFDEESDEEEMVDLQTNFNTSTIDNGLTLYVVKTSDNKYQVGTTDNIDKLREIVTNATIEQCCKVSSTFDELTKVYELMCLYGVANVRGSRYNQPKLSLVDANELIKITTYFNGDALIIDKNSIPDRTVVETYMLWRNGFTVDEIAEMKSLRVTTIQFHLDKIMKSGIKLQKENDVDSTFDEETN